MATIDTSIEINASIDKVWDIISDGDSYRVQGFQVYAKNHFRTKGKNSC